jgi:exoribonuclease-2
MNVLFEEDGAFKAGVVLADNNTSLQVELPSGKRSKVKAANLLLRFTEPGSIQLLDAAQAEAEGIDPDFLWQVCGDEEFGFDDLAKEYFGRPPSPVEATAILLRLHGAPIYFHRKGRGRFRKAPPEILQAALAGLEKKRQQAAAIERMAEELKSFHLPAELAPLVAELLYKPDRNKPETKALEAACAATGLSAPHLLARCGAVPSSHDYHFNRFVYEHFPRGTGFGTFAPAVLPDDLTYGEVRAFSIDDATTTEIDDAFSITPRAGGGWRIGIHIAAPGLGFGPGSELDQIARNRLSTVYMPGRKITMLPDEVVDAFTLCAGRATPALSLYVDVAADFSILGATTEIEYVPVVANLRHHDVEPVFNEDTLARGGPDFPFKEELTVLWHFANVLEAGRGKPSANQAFSDYSYYVDWGVPEGRVTIVERKRGSPLDKLVAELMILANSTWGKLLAEGRVAAIYRTQAAGKVRMTTAALSHEGLGVECYAWSSSPLRRYVDLVNQWQLIALLRQDTPPFSARSEMLLSALRDFELAYAAYNEFQRQMERYWCLRWVLQEAAPQYPARVVRESLVRLEAVPLFLRCPSLPACEPGTRMAVNLSEIDLLELEAACRYLGPLPAPPGAQPEKQNLTGNK